MSQWSTTGLTGLLQAAGKGDANARSELWSAVYDELIRIAQNHRKKEPAGRLLETTALVHEAYFRLFPDQEVDWSSRRHFFGAAARAMRQILIDDARSRKRLKRGGGERAHEFREHEIGLEYDPIEVLAVHEALDKLQEKDPRKAEIVMLRYFAGLTIEDTASAMGLSRRTIELDWRVARAWLHRELSGED
jgi:RNA polymerase sigma factor (TIGR02999 family)